jgi:hypothetical protein
VLEEERRGEDLEQLLVPHTAVHDLLQEPGVLRVSDAVVGEKLVGVRIDGSPAGVVGMHQLLAEPHQLAHLKPLRLIAVPA